MKKNYTYIFLFVSVVLYSVNASGTVWNVTVNAASFTPGTLPNVTCGDTVRWTLGSGSHTTTSTSIPPGATSWDAPINGSSTTFEYTVPNFAGVYDYECTPHGFTGSFTVICTVGVKEVEPAVLFAIYPNPFVSGFTLLNHDADDVKIMDVNGQVVKAIPINTSGDKSEIQLDAFAPGIYFLTIWSEGVIRQTQKIIKVK